MKGLIRKTLLLGMVLASVFSASASLHLDRLLASRAVERATAALLVVDIVTGDTLDAFNADKPLIPASILKTVTIASLLPESGASYRYLTRVYADGDVKDGTLLGNLRIVGSGDPSINAGCEPAGPDFLSEIAGALKAEGISRIGGKIEVDCSVFTGPAAPDSWAAADRKQKYGTGCHGFNFRHNASGNTAVADPTAAFISALTSRLKAEGITVENGAVKGTKSKRELLLHNSATIDEIMRSCMMRSDNLFAEALLRTLPLTRGRAGNPTEAAAMELSIWKKKGVDTAGVTIIDGSGLSRSNRVTADFIGGVLTAMAPDPDYASFLPLAGQEGTLKSFLKDTPLDSYIALKTGSMNGIQCYAGYKLDEDFVPTHVVVVILNSLPRGRTSARAAVERYLLDLFE